MTNPSLLERLPSIEGYKRYLLLFATLLVIVVCATRIAQGRFEAVYDQKKLLEHSLSCEDYPALESGLSSSLLVGLYNVFSPSDSAWSNACLRTLAMLLYLMSGFALFSTLQGGNSTALSLLFIMLLSTSRFPFLWLSSELLAGAFLMLLLWSVARNSHFLVVSVCTTLFSLSKPDLALPGIVVGLLLAFRMAHGPKEKLTNVGILLVAIGALLVPGVIRSGFSYFASQGRALFSFGQHYAAMVAKHQVASAKPDPWIEWELYFRPIWGQPESFLQAIRSSPSRYVDFVFLSMSHSVKNFVRSNLFLLLPPAAYSIARTRQSTLKLVSLLLLCGFIPITLLSYTHTRYIARFYPLFLFMTYLFITESQVNKKEQKLISYYLTGVLAIQLCQLPSVFAAGYWFPD